MSELISTIQPDEANEGTNDEEEKQEEEDNEDIETTSLANIEEFNKWAKMQARKDLAMFKNLTDVCDINAFRLSIASLNNQQRKLFMLAYTAGT